VPSRLATICTPLPLKPTERLPSLLSSGSDGSGELNGGFPAPAVRVK